MKKIALKIHIYNEILFNWEAIPDNFTLSDLQEICNMHERSVYSLQKQLYHMRDIGMIFLGTRKTWHKTHKHLDTWFSNYLKKLGKTSEVNTNGTR
jgi:hypothetical protein